MNQTRTFLIFAWLMVATLLWMEWGKEQREPLPAAQAALLVKPSDRAAPPAETSPGRIRPGLARATAPRRGRRGLQHRKAQCIRPVDRVT